MNEVPSSEFRVPRGAGLSFGELRELFLTPRAKRTPERSRATTVLAPPLYDVDGEEVRPALVGRAVVCAGCNNPRGTLRKAREGVYLHRRCTERKPR